MTSPTPRISVLLFCRGEARFVGDALASLNAQRGAACDVITVDEGLSSAGSTRLEAALAETGRAGSPRIDARQCDAFESLARGVAQAGPVVAGLEQDDLFHPERLATLLMASRPHGDRWLAMSATAFIDAVGDAARDESEAVKADAGVRFEASRCPSVGFALLRHDLAGSRSNLVFTRALFDVVKDEPSTETSASWRLALSSLPLTEPLFSSVPLLSRRDLGTRVTTDADLDDQQRRARIDAWNRRIETRPPANALAPSPANWPFYYDLFVARALAARAHRAVDDRGPDEDARAAAPRVRAHPADAWHTWGETEASGHGEFLTDPGVAEADRATVALAREVLASFDSRIDGERRALGSSLERIHALAVHGHDANRPAQPWPDTDAELDRAADDDTTDTGIAPSPLRRFARRFRFAAAVRRVRDRQFIRRSGVFDARFYRAQAREAGAFVFDPISHFLRTAETLELSPHPLFDTRYYLARNPDVRDLVNPLVHYLRCGDEEGRRPHWLFDPDWYRIQHPDVDDRGDHTLEHYLRYGASEGRAGNPRYDIAGALHEAAGAEGLQRWRRFLEELDEGTDAHGSRIALRRALARNDAAGGRVELARDIRRQHAHARALRRSRIFDPAFYTLWWGRERHREGDAAKHFLEVGGIEGVGFCGVDRIHDRLEELARGFEDPHFDGESHAEFEYLRTSSQGGVASTAAPGHHVTLYASSKGNVFFAEMAELLAHGFMRAGASVEIRDERKAPDTTALEADTHRIVVAPHEFFLLGRGPSHLSRDFIETTSLWLAEQPGSEFFAMTMWFGALARRILDINPLSALAWSELGFDARALPLGFIDGFDDYADARSIADPALAAGLRKRARPPVETDSVWAERPIDVCFNGVLTPRREAFFARHAELFAELECALHMPSPHTPVSARLASALMPADATALSQRSKILLNVHRGETGYFEWHRLVVRGLWQKTLVLSEKSMPVPWLDAGEHYLEAELDELPGQIEWLLHSKAGQDEAERVRHAGHERLRARYDLTSTCRAFLEDDARFTPSWQREEA